MRSMWKGSISFGLVTIPVKLYAATESKDVRFNLLHEACGTPISYRKWCPNCDREIAAEEVVKGYEYERGRYVLVTEEDLESIPVAAAHTLEIVGFINMAEIDPVYFDKTYYMEPGEGGAKAYALLRRAMEETGRVAVARVVIRTKESLAAIRVFQEGVLALETMHFPDEVRSVAGLTGIVQPEIRPQELQMAIGLIESLSGEFRPEAYQNEYRAAVLERIDAKVTGQEVTEAAPSPERGRVVDLMEALRASIRQAEEARGAEPAAAPMPAPPFPGAPVAPGVPAIPGVGAGAPAAAGAVPGLPGVPGAPRPAAVPPVPPAPGIGISAPLGPGAAAPGVPVPGPGQ